MQAPSGIISIFVFIFLFNGLSNSAQIEQETVFSDEEVAVLRSLWIGSLPSLPHDPSNNVDENPLAVQFGKKLFSDTRFSANNKISCATCHKADVAFSDNKPLAEGVSTSTRRGMPIIGMAYFKWFFWDGRADSLWSQALGPFVTPRPTHRLPENHLSAWGAPSLRLAIYHPFKIQK